MKPQRMPALGILAVESIGPVADKNSACKMDLAKGSGDCCYCCHSMRMASELLELGKSAVDRGLFAGIDFLAQRAAGSSGIAVIVATALAMVIEWTWELADHTLAGEDSQADYTVLLHNLVLARMVAAYAAALDISLRLGHWVYDA